MVDPISTEERRSKLRRLKLGIALLVGVSAGLVAVQRAATVPQIGGAAIAGTVFGGLLVWYVFPSAEDYR